MIANFLIIFVFLAIFLCAAGIQRDKLKSPQFRMALLYELPLYLAVVNAVQVIAFELFGAGISLIPAIMAVFGIRFVRMGYPNFLKLWQERGNTWQISL